MKYIIAIPIALTMLFLIFALMGCADKQNEPHYTLAKFRPHTGYYQYTKFAEANK